MRDDDIVVRIELPLPLDVVSTIVKMFGVVYPHGMMSTRSGSMLELHIPQADRGRLGNKRAIAKVKDKAEQDPALEGQLGDLKEGGVIGLIPPEQASHVLGAACAAVFTEYPDETAPNYLEWDCSTEDGLRFFVAACRSAGQSPHALRQKADRERDQARARVEELEAELAKARVAQQVMDRLLTDEEVYVDWRGGDLVVDGRITLTKEEWSVVQADKEVPGG